jgi:ubiquinone/menaquinone biosynthesis C-methylase UbiE
MDRLASGYDRSMDWDEKLLFGGGHEWVCSRARGDVLEIAIGTGRNLPYYPQYVRLTGIDLSPAMLQIAGNRAASLGIEVDLRPVDAQALTLPGASFDSVGCTISLCTIPDDRKALQEVEPSSRTAHSR